VGIEELFIEVTKEKPATAGFLTFLAFLVTKARLTVSSNIYLNSFMYKSILDLTIGHLSIFTQSSIVWLQRLVEKANIKGVSA